MCESGGRGVCVCVWGVENTEKFLFIWFHVHLCLCVTPALSCSQVLLILSVIPCVCERDLLGSHTLS